MDKSLDTAFSCYGQAGCLLLPGLHHWSKWFPTIFVDPYDLVIFEEKGDIGKGIAVLLIITKPPLIPGIHHLVSGVELWLQPWSD